jgi:hypothetical protein
MVPAPTRGSSGGSFSGSSSGSFDGSSSSSGSFGGSDSSSDDDSETIHIPNSSSSRGSVRGSRDSSGNGSDSASDDDSETIHTPKTVTTLSLNGQAQTGDGNATVLVTGFIVAAAIACAAMGAILYKKRQMARAQDDEAMMTPKPVVSSSF